ncbi:MAG: ThuA domain-containing protein [bacterium]|nr:ThuA domain-containing protein [bacterium]
MPRWIVVLPLLMLSACTLSPPGKKIVLIAGKKSHGPGAHEYLKSVKLLKVMLDRSPNLTGVRTEIHFNGWPEDPRTLDTADTIVTISDGQDGDKYSPAPFMTRERMAVMERQMKRGCGFVTIHFSTFTPDEYGDEIIEWGGGYFDWQGDDGQREWYSAIKTLEADVEIGEPDHAISRGVKPFRYKEEFYYRIRFGDDDSRLKQILRVPALGGSPAEQTVAWAVERTGGGRGFSTTAGHFYDNWKIADYRKLILNGIVWSAGAAVPDGGVESSFFTDAEVDEALMENPVRTLLLTGHDHPAHKWQETHPAIIRALNSETPRFEVEVVTDPEYLTSNELFSYHLLVLNYANWKRPGLGEEAKTNLIRYLDNGGGLAIIHFANGAFHFSLPEAGESDWPEYRKICRRVWDHSTGASGHDPYGEFRVEITNTNHPVTRHIEDFGTTDELYYRQQGDGPIEVLATARSSVTGEDEPMAWVYQYGPARVFQTVLGHAAESIHTPGTTQLIRYGSLWAAQPPTPQSPVSPVP